MAYEKIASRVRLAFAVIFTLWLATVETLADEIRLAEVVEKRTAVYLGTAMMSDDGTITVTLDRKVGGKSAQEVSRYVSTDPSYQQVMLHVGGLKPGESKPVLSWPPGS